MSTMFADTILIVFISVCTALLAEGITWILVYRTDKYKRLKAEVEKQSKKCEFDGRVVAKLPFIPLSYIQGLSHRNLLGEDCTDCSFIFLYILCTMSIRQNIQKLLGLAPSRAATKQAGGFLGPPPQAGKFS
ncbi:hypothetical protein Chor_003271 [Crotalus horridus]